MKVLFLVNIPSPYRVDFFNELGRLCELTVLFEKSNSSERDKSWEQYNFVNFNGIILKGRITDVDKAFCIPVIKYLHRKMFDIIVVANTPTPTGILAINYMKVLNIPYVIEGDGGFAKSGRGIKETLKRCLIRGASAYLSTSKSHDEYYLKYGADSERIYRYPFTSLRDSDVLTKSMSQAQKQEIKKTLGIVHNKFILSVGQFIHRKGFDILLDVCQNIDKSVGVYIIGGTPTQEYIRKKAALNLYNVQFAGFKQKSEILRYYKACDVFVLPTREDIWGLVVNEALACGAPVITTNRCGAGLELIENGVNGYIVPVDESKLLSERINSVLNDDMLRERMSINALRKIKNYTIENMAKRHIQIFEELKNENTVFRLCHK